MLVPLLLLLLGIVEFGRVYAMQYQLQNASRDAARAIALQYDDPGIGLGDLQNIADDALDIALGDTLSDALTKAITYCTPDGLVPDARVVLSKEEALAIPFMNDGSSGAFTTTIAGASTMPCEG